MQNYYLNVYLGFVSSSYNTLDEADEAAENDRIAVIVLTLDEDGNVLSTKNLPGGML